MASEMVERVIKAMKDEVFGCGHDVKGNRCDVVEVDFLALARAAIEAMREPTELMARTFMAHECTDAMTDDDFWPYRVVRRPRGAFDESYRAMIDAALKD